MYFKLYHDPQQKTLTIPRAALQLSELSTAEEMTLHAERGCVLLARNDLTARECLRVIDLLFTMGSALTSQLAMASQEVREEHGALPELPADKSGPFRRLNDRLLSLLLVAGTDLGGLSRLLMWEDEDEH